MKRRATLEVRPVTAERWADLETLFGTKGACAGCWCMFFRQTSREFAAGKGAGNRRAMKSLVARGEEPGLIAYDGEQPVGWCALAPREAFTRIERSRTLKRLDDTKVWSLPCFFVARTHRRRGVTVALLRAAAERARERGVVALEGYPVEPRTAVMPDVFAYHGLASAFRAAGFREAAAPSLTRRVMRLELGGRRASRDRRPPA